MTKIVDVRKSPAVPAIMGIRRAGKTSIEEVPLEEKMQSPPKIARKKSFVGTFIGIAVYDVKRKLGLAKAPVGELQKKMADWEKFENFCKTARGEQ